MIEDKIENIMDYSEICFIVLWALQKFQGILGFSVPSIILATS